MRIVGLRTSRASTLGVIKGEHVLDLSELAIAAGQPAPFLASMALFLGAGEEVGQFVARLLSESHDDVVGAFCRPPIYTEDGDLAAIKIENLGTLRNRVRV